MLTLEGVGKDSKQEFKKLAVIFGLLFLPALGIEVFDSLGAVDSNTGFSFDREMLAQGEWWRFLSGHFDHLSWSHLWLNAIFLAVLLLTFTRSLSVLAIVGLFCAYSFGISVLIWFCSPELDIYVGLSGCLYSFLVLCLLRDTSFPFWVRGLVLLGLIVKVLYEYFNGASAQIGELIGGTVATDVHIYGVVLGLLSVILLKLFKV